MIAITPSFDLGKKIGTWRIEMNAASVKEIIQNGIKEYGDDFKEMVDTNTILVNGRNIRYLKGLKTRLNDGDSVNFVEFAAGG